MTTVHALPPPYVQPMFMARPCLSRLLSLKSCVGCALAFFCQPSFHFGKLLKAKFSNFSAPILLHSFFFSILPSIFANTCVCFFFACPENFFFPPSLNLSLKQNDHVQHSGLPVVHSKHSMGMVFTTSGIVNLSGIRGILCWND